jgi:nucleoid-associated protein YgaU
MGLLQFIKNVGDKFSGKVDGKAIEEKIRNDLGSQIIELSVEMEEDQVVLSGFCESNDAREKAVLLAGNTKGVSGVNYFKFRVQGAADSDEDIEKAVDEEAAVAEEGQAIPSPSGETDFYTIASGDTLSKLAKKYYGDASQYDVIFEANREVIKDPNKIYVGQTIRIPKNV